MPAGDQGWPFTNRTRVNRAEALGADVDRANDQQHCYSCSDAASMGTRLRCNAAKS